MRFYFATIRLLRQHLAQTINDVFLRHKIIYVTRNGRVVAEIRPVPEGRQRFLKTVNDNQIKTFKRHLWPPRDPPF